MRKAVFLDRDGVLNRAQVRNGKPYPPANVDEVEILPGVETALQLLRRAGFVLIVVTNQPDVATGKTSKENVDSINAYLASHLPIDRIITCCHAGSDNCECRKPRSGMLIAGAREFNVDLRSSYIVGDRWRDIEAGRNVGCKTVFIDYGYAERQPGDCSYKTMTLLLAAGFILNENLNENS